MRKISLEVSSKSSPENILLVVDLEEEEVHLLETFYEQAERLTASSVLEAGMPANLKISYENGKPLEFTESLPADEPIRALLHSLRPFILNDEYASYNRAAGLLGKKFENPAIRSMLKKQRQLYDGRDFQSQIEIVADGAMINSEKLLFDWLNSFEYHNDQTKKRELEKLHELMPLKASRAIFFMLLTDKVSAILNVADFIGLLFGKVTTFESRS